MSKQEGNKVLIGSGLILALTSSLCCIMPILAVIGGSGSSLAAFSWAAPLRPYCMGATVLVLGFAFYRAYKPQPKDNCNCEEKKSFLQSKSFLWTITGISVLLSTFPYYAFMFQSKSPGQQVVADNASSLQQATIHIRGMSCEACEGHVNNALLQKKGVQYVNTSYNTGISIVKFDSLQISLQQLAQTIENETGYKVIQ